MALFGFLFDGEDWCDVSGGIGGIILWLVTTYPPVKWLGIGGLFHQYLQWQHINLLHSELWVQNLKSLAHPEVSFFSLHCHLILSYVQNFKSLAHQIVSFFFFIHIFFDCHPILSYVQNFKFLAYPEVNFFSLNIFLHCHPILSCVQNFKFLAHWGGGGLV